MQAVSHINSDQHFQQRLVNVANSNLPLDLDQYEQASSEQIIVEFARNSYPLLGAVIDGNTIRGEFGYGEIQQPRNQKLILLQKGILKQVPQVSKILITKSKLNSKKNYNQIPQKSNINHSNLAILQNTSAQHVEFINLNHIPSSIVQAQNNQNLIQDVNQQMKSEPPQPESEQRFFSQSSESSQVQQRQRRQAKNLLKKQQSISKSSSHRQNPSKISKNILKKKLKYLSQKK